MSKYLSAAARSLSIPADLPQKEPSVCERCQWNFAIDNDVWRSFDGKDPKRKRKEPRTEINVPRHGGGTMVRCSDCYEVELRHSGRHSNQSHDGASICREALKL